MGLKIWISGEIMHDIGANFRPAILEIEGAINQVLDHTDYGDGLIEWDHIAIILDFDDPTYHEVKRYRKKKREVEFRLKVSHEEFKAADPRGQHKLLMDMLLRSIDEMKAMKIPNFDLQKLESDMRELAAAKGWV